ncbi:MAG: hypothetical protein V4459_08475 [Pseudomonadota bacterium]
MSFYRPTALELAMHEAGHAYAFSALLHLEEPYELGLRVNDAGEANGWCRRREIAISELPLSRVPDDVRPGFEWQAGAEVVVAIAGPIAECRHRQRNRLVPALDFYRNAEAFLAPATLDVDGDFQRIRENMEYLQPGDPVAALRALMEIADEAVHRNWPAIKRLGRELFARRTLGEDDLAAWFADNRAKRCDALLSANFGF